MPTIPPDYDTVIADARARIEQAIYDVIAVRAVQEGGYELSVGDTPFLVAWGVAYEFTTNSLEDDNKSADGVITSADSASRSTSRGIFELAVDKFRI